MDTTILVSILIPVYNRQDIIVATINSALLQTYSNIEIIIVDNKSIDRTYEICKQYQNVDYRIKVFQNEVNIGPVKNWQKCLEYSSGDYVKFLWSDDWMDKDYLEKTVPYLVNADVAFAYSSVEIVGKSHISSAYRLYETDHVFSSELFSDLSVFRGNVPVSPGCGIFRRSDVEKNLLLDIPNNDNLNFNNFGAGNDLLLFLLPLINYRCVAFVASTKCYFRYHTGSISMSNSLELYYDWAKLYYLRAVNNEQKIMKFKSILTLQSLKAGNYRKYRNIIKAINIRLDYNYFLEIITTSFVNRTLKIHKKRGDKR